MLYFNATGWHNSWLFSQTKSPCKDLSCPGFGESITIIIRPLNRNDYVIVNINTLHTDHYYVIVNINTLHTDHYDVIVNINTLHTDHYDVIVNIKQVLCCVGETDPIASPLVQLLFIENA
jgi:hypothetical protein